MILENYKHVFRKILKNSDYVKCYVLDSFVIRILQNKQSQQI